MGVITNCRAGGPARPFLAKLKHRSGEVAQGAEPVMLVYKAISPEVQRSVDILVVLVKANNFIRAYYLAGRQTSPLWEV